MNRELIIPIGTSLAIGLAFWFVSLTISSVLLFIPGILAAFIIYKKIFYKKNNDATHLLSLYLLALGVQFLHFAEEYVTDFVTLLPALIGQEPYPINYWLIFNMIAYFFFILGGIFIYKNQKEFLVIPIFFVLVGVFFNSVAHVSLALYVGGYFPGLYTAIIYLFFIPLFIKKLRFGTKSVENY